VFWATIPLAPTRCECQIILVALVVAAKLAELRPLLGIVSLAGGAYVLYLAWDSFRPVRVVPEASPEPPRSWFKGIFTNLLSPHPWLFWLTIGAAILAEALAQSWLVAVAFLFGFYLLLVGSKVLVALMAGGCPDRQNDTCRSRQCEEPGGADLPAGDARAGGAAGVRCDPAVPRGTEASGSDTQSNDHADGRGWHGIRLHRNRLGRAGAARRNPLLAMEV
jgi:hypothetical protein